MFTGQTNANLESHLSYHYIDHRKPGTAIASLFINASHYLVDLELKESNGKTPMSLRLR
jgi:hypothetical protein